MSVDVVHIIQRGRHRLEQLRARLVAERADHEPRRVVAVSLHFAITGDVADKVVARAIRLSREKYCAVWHSMRADIDTGVSATAQDDGWSGLLMYPLVEAEATAAARHQKQAHATYMRNLGVALRGERATAPNHLADQPQ